MKFIKRLFLTVIIIAALAAGVSQLLPGHFRVERSLIIDASAEKILPLVNNIKQWPTWTAWNTNSDPTMVFSYEGPEEGVGAISRWNSKQGDGRMTITESDPSKGVKFDMWMMHDQCSAKGWVSFAPAGSSTKVLFGFEGDLSRNPLHRWMGVFVEQMAGPDFEKGLKGLKKAAEGK